MKSSSKTDTSKAATAVNTAEATALERGARKTREGIVVSNKMQKTIVVRVDRRAQHSTYGRVINLSTSFKAHDEQNVAKVGDLVRIMETRPISKDKRWRLVEVVRKASSAPALPDGEASESKSKKKAASGGAS